MTGRTHLATSCRILTHSMTEETPSYTIFSTSCIIEKCLLHHHWQGNEHIHNWYPSNHTNQKCQRKMHYLLTSWFVSAGRSGKRWSSFSKLILQILALYPNSQLQPNQPSSLNHKNHHSSSIEQSLLQAQNTKPINHIRIQINPNLQSYTPTDCYTSS